MADYSKWVDRIYESSTEARLGEIDHILNKFGRLSQKASDLAEAISDLKEFEKPSFLTHLHEVPLKKVKPGFIGFMKFPGPVVAVKHKRLPLVLAVSKHRKDFASKYVSYESVEKDFDIRQILSWANAVSYMTTPEKKQLAKLLITGIERQRKSKASDETWLSEFISSQKEFTIEGFAANAPYINVDKNYGDTKPIWVHPWGIPALLLKHKTLPVIMMVSPAIRLNENLLGSNNMEGYTG